MEPATVRASNEAIVRRDGDGESAVKAASGFPVSRSQRLSVLSAEADLDNLPESISRSSKIRGHLISRLDIEPFSIEHGKPTGSVTVDGGFFGPFFTIVFLISSLFSLLF